LIRSTVLAVILHADSIVEFLPTASFANKNRGDGECYEANLKSALKSSSSITVSV